MAERQQALAEHLLKDPAVASISSFIGVDGTNTTLNTGRMQIDLKPHAQRDRLPVVLNAWPRLRAVPGIRLYAQPVQDLTIEDRQARTQYQLLLSSPDMNQLTASTKLVERLQQLPQLLDASSDLQNQGRQAYVQIDRAQASRLGVTAVGGLGALQRFRPAPDLHHLHAVQPVPRGAGGGAAVQDRARGPAEHLCRIEQRARRCRCPRLPR
jgi:multidrug efflux pump subunit AcrB